MRLLPLPILATPPALPIVTPTGPFVQPPAPTMEAPTPVMSAELAGATLKPDVIAEIENPITDQKIGPWAFHKTSSGIVIDREITAGMKRASGGIYFELTDPGYGTLHVLISSEPKVATPDTVEPPIAEAEPVVDAMSTTTTTTTEPGSQPGEG